jgi:hypothetical protein
VHDLLLPEVYTMVSSMRYIKYFLYLSALASIVTFYHAINQLIVMKRPTCKNTPDIKLSFPRTISLECPPLRMLDAGSRRLIGAARQIQSHSRTVLVTVVNTAYFPFLYSWLCNTEPMGIHRQVLVITTNMTSQQRLQADWPALSVVCIENLAVEGDQQFAHAGTLRIQLMRAELLRLLLMCNIKLLLFECDCMWLKNPVPQLEALDADYDFVVTPVNGNQDGTNEVMAGFLYMVPNFRMRALWDAMTLRLHHFITEIRHMQNHENVNMMEMDNIYLRDLVNTHYSGIRVYGLSYREFPDGTWYDKSDPDHDSDGTWANPVLINNNFIAGNVRKIERAKLWGHWFLMPTWKCNTTQVNKMLTYFTD